MGWFPCGCCEDGCAACSDGTPDPISLTISGVGNSACSTCTDFNATWMLPYVGNCRWEYEGTFTCGGYGAVPFKIDVFLAHTGFPQRLEMYARLQVGATTGDSYYIRWSGVKDFGYVTSIDCNDTQTGFLVSRQTLLPPNYCDPDSSVSFRVN